MRIAIFTDLYLENAGGICSSIAAQKEALKAMGHEVKVFCPGYPTSTDDPDVVLVPTSFIRIEGAPMAKAPKKIVKFLEAEFPDFEKRFDVIHAHYEAQTSIAAVYMARRHKIPLVQTMHGREDIAVAVNFPKGLRRFSGFFLDALHKHYLGDLVPVAEQPKVAKDDYLAFSYPRKKMWQVMVRQANCADVTLTPARHFKEKLEHYGAKNDIQILPNGVSDNLVFAEDWGVRKFDESYVHDGEKLRIVWTTRVSREKRIIPFLQALALVREHTDGFFLTVIGNGNDMKKARKFVATHGLADNVGFLGEIPHEEVIKNLKNQHISITNSFGFDVQPLTLLEAVAALVPVIICDPDMEGLLPEGVYRIAKDETPEAMAEVLLDILNRPGQIEEMSQRALEVCEETLQSTQIRKLVKIYKSLA